MQLAIENSKIKKKANKIASINFLPHEIFFNEIQTIAIMEKGIDK